MSKTPEIRVAEQIANLVESHWFNPATMARYLMDQPFYTIDRIIELVAQIIYYDSKRHLDELGTESGIYNSGNTSEGLFLANELNIKLTELVNMYKWENLTLPKEGAAARYIKDLPDLSYNPRHSFLDEPYREHSFEAQRVSFF